VLREIVRPVDFVAPPGRSRHLPHVSPEDIALREVIEGKISYELHTA
jgi:hypothetical protein